MRQQKLDYQFQQSYWSRWLETISIYEVIKVILTNPNVWKERKLVCLSRLNLFVFKGRIPEMMDRFCLAKLHDSEFVGWSPAGKDLSCVSWMSMTSSPPLEVWSLIFVHHSLFIWLFAWMQSKIHVSWTIVLYPNKDNNNTPQPLHNTILVVGVQRRNYVS